MTHARPLFERIYEYIDSPSSPSIYSKWAALSCLGGCLERRVWKQTQRGRIYPNMYNILLGHAGIGKTLSIKLVGQLWHSTGIINTGPNTITHASLIDILVEAAAQQRTIDGMIQEHACVAFPASEFAGMVDGYDQTLLTRLADLYDCPQEYESRTRGAGAKKIVSPSVYLIGGITPDQLNATLPETAWKQGFMSRVVLVYASSANPPSQEELFPSKVEKIPKEKLLNEIVPDLKRICNQCGQMEFEPEAIQSVMAWIHEGQPPIPTHPKLATYNSRRMLHTWKMSMALAASEFSHVITVKNFTDAKKLLLEAEEGMNDAFSDMTSTSDSQAIKEVFNWLVTATVKLPGGVSDGQMRHAFSKHVATFQIDGMFNHMISTGQIIKKLTLEGAKFTAGEIPK